MAQHHPHQAFGYSSSSSSMHQSFDTCDSGELLGLQAGMEMLSLPANSLFPTQISCSQGLLSLSLSHPENLYHHQQQQQQQQQQHLGGFHQSYQLRNSVYLRPAQELLNEFCRLDVGSGSNSKQKQKERKDQEDHDAPSSSSSWNQSLLTMDVLELQKRKALLLSMLEEVDRRYKKYYEQMQRVVSSFEAVAGEGSAVVYSRLALRAMSKHFRGLRDGIVEQLKAMKKVMGEKDDTYTVSSGTTSKGATPRLRLLDQCLRQQKAQSGLLESQPWRPQRGLPERSVTILRAWLFDHFLHPYPSDVDKHILARQTGLSRSQVSNWFINARVRLWKPMVEEMYMKETEDHDNSNNNNESDNDIDSNNPHSNQNPNPNPYPNSSYDHQDQKPRLAAPDHHHLQIDGPDSNFGVVDLDFSPYNNNNNNNQGYGNGVSLSLGLQQSLFLSREHMEVLDGDLQAQNLPYRDLMGSHLLHDLA